MKIEPEIQMPGDAVAGIAAYPWLCCGEREVKVITSWGILTRVLWTKEKVMILVEDVMTEVMELFAGNMIQVEGDECASGDWDN
jgi:hexosaminidase